MKKITLLLLAFIAFNFVNAQATCATASTITAGTTTVAAVNGTEIPNPECAANAGGARAAGVWYTFTATVNGTANITTDLPANAGGDTRVHIYSGDCASLACVGGNDDVDGTNFLSNATFPVTLGTSYYVAFDDRWSAAGFDFVLSEAEYTCANTFPYTDDMQDAVRYQVCYTNENSNADALAWTYNTINDLDGDGTNDNIANVFPPDPTLAKDDWLFTTELMGTANTEYSITLVYNSVDVRGTASEDFEIVALNSPSSSATTQEVLGTFTDITQSGVFGDTGGNDLITQAYSSLVTYTPTADGPFHIGIHATTPMVDSDVFMVMSMSISAALSVDEFDSNSFTYNYSKANKTLNLESSTTALSSIEVYSILGQNVITRPLSNTTESIDVSSLKDGVYLAKVNINGNSKTIKFVKN